MRVSMIVTWSTSDVHMSSLAWYEPITCLVLWWNVLIVQETCLKKCCFWVECWWERCCCRYASSIDSLLEEEEQFADQLKEYYGFGDSLRYKLGNTAIISHQGQSIANQQIDKCPIHFSLGFTWNFYQIFRCHLHEQIQQNSTLPFLPPILPHGNFSETPWSPNFRFVHIDDCGIFGQTIQVNVGMKCLSHPKYLLISNGVTHHCVTHHTADITTWWC